MYHKYPSKSCWNPYGEDVEFISTHAFIQNYSKIVSWPCLKAFGKNVIQKTIIKNEKKEWIGSDENTVWLLVNKYFAIWITESTRVTSRDYHVSHDSWCKDSVNLKWAVFRLYSLEIRKDKNFRKLFLMIMFRTEKYYFHFHWFQNKILVCLKLAIRDPRPFWVGFHTSWRKMGRKMSKFFMVRDFLKIFLRARGNR